MAEDTLDNLPIQTDTLEDELKRSFGFDSFQPGQREVIADVLSQRPTIAIMPTGAGKSLCYQLPAVLLDGLCVVVSPLIALMKDQVDGCRRRGIEAAFINSTQTSAEQRSVMRSAQDGELQLLYVAPERFRSNRFLESMRQIKVDLFAVDEAHCISRWGHDFRPDYSRLGDVIDNLQPSRILACTATATVEVRSDIVRTLRLRDPAIHVAGFLRDNLHLGARLCRGDQERSTRLFEAIDQHRGNGAAMVYASTRKRVDHFAQLCRNRYGHRDVVAYHAGHSDDEREDAQNRFIRGDAHIAVATNAFGMGIDRADIRVVVHLDLPRSIEGYYQEVGRAGRDGSQSVCVLLFNPIDRRTHEFLIDLSHPEPDWIRQCWRLLTLSRPNTLTFRAIADGIDGLRSGQVEAAMKTLQRVGAVREVSDGDWQAHPHAPEDVTELGIDAQSLLELRSREIKRLDNVCDLAYGRPCRHEKILGYFGEEFDVSTCPGCDKCHPLEQEDEHTLSADELVIVRKALAGVARAQGRFGLKKVAGMLAGSRARSIIQSGLGSLSTYGMLKELGTNGCADILQALTERGLCRLAGGQYPLLAISKEGWEVMQGRSDAPPMPTIRTQGKMAKRALYTSENEAVSTSSAPEQTWITRVKEFRTAEAKRRSVAPFMVFSNRTMNEIAAQRPITEQDFLSIHGLGSARWDTFGERLIAMIKEQPVLEED